MENIFEMMDVTDFAGFCFQKKKAADRIEFESWFRKTFRRKTTSEMEERIVPFIEKTDELLFLIENPWGDEEDYQAALSLSVNDLV